jgi:Flp pilus assembly protein TadD
MPARASSTTAKRASATRHNAYNSRGIAWHQKDEFERALDDYNAALRLVPNDIDVLINRAVTYRVMRESHRARAAHRTGRCRRHSG